MNSLQDSKNYFWKPGTRELHFHVTWLDAAWNVFQKHMTFIKKIKGFKKGMLKLQKPKGQLGNKNNMKLDFGAGS